MAEPPSLGRHLSRDRNGKLGGSRHRCRLGLCALGLAWARGTPGRESSNSKKLAVADGGVARGGRGGSASTRAPGLRRANCFRVAGRDLGFRGIVRGIAFGSKSCGFRKWVGMGHSALGLMDHPYPNWAYDPGSPGAETYI